MPEKIQAVKCVQCNTLTAITDRYLTVAVLDIKLKLADDASTYDKQHAPIIKLTDTTFCDVDCLNHHLRNQVNN